MSAPSCRLVSGPRRRLVVAPPLNGLANSSSGSWRRRRHRQTQQPQSGPDASTAAPGRLVLDAELASLLQQVQAQGQFRTSPAALRLVLRHFIGHGSAPTAELDDATPHKHGVAALMRSNHELLPIGKNINQIVKSLNAMHGGFRNTDTKNLPVFAQAVREHVEQAARVVATIRALVTPHKEKS